MLSEDNNGEVAGEANYVEAEDSEGKHFPKLLPIQHRKYAGLLPVKVQVDGDFHIIKTYILHLAAKRDLCRIASLYMELYPENIYQIDEGKRKMPVEVALAAENDAVCTVIMKSMLNLR